MALEVIADSQAQCALFANPTPAGIALRDRFNALLGAHESLRRDLALRLSGLAVRYGGAASAPAGVAGARVPDLDLRGAPTPSVFGLLSAAKFVLLDLSAGGAVLSWLGQRLLAGYTDRLSVVAGELADDHPDWADARALLIRPDGHLAWVLRAGDTDTGAGDLARWLGTPRY